MVDDARSGTSFALPVAGARIGLTDDIWSLIAFGNDKIGMMWSNQKLGAFSFAVHNDAGADATWQAPEVALSRRGYSVRSGAGAARG